MRKLGGLFIVAALVATSAGTAAAGAGSPLTPYPVTATDLAVQDVPPAVGLASDTLGNVVELVPPSRYGSGWIPDEVWAGPATGPLADLGPAPLGEMDINDGWVGIPTAQHAVPGAPYETSAVTLVRLSDGTRTTWTAPDDENYLGQTGDGGVLAERSGTHWSLVWHKADGTDSTVTTSVGGGGAAVVVGHRVVITNGGATDANGVPAGVVFANLDVPGSARTLNEFYGTGFLSADTLGYETGDSGADTVHWWDDPDGTGTEHVVAHPSDRVDVTVSHDTLRYLLDKAPVTTLVTVDVSGGSWGAVTSYDDAVVASGADLAELPGGDVLAVEHPAGDRSHPAVGRFAGGVVTPLLPVSPAVAEPLGLGLDDGRLSVLDASGPAGAQQLRLFDAAGNVVSSQPIDGEIGGINAGYGQTVAAGGYTVLAPQDGFERLSLQVYDPQGRLVYEDDNAMGQATGLVDGIVSYLAENADGSQRFLTTVNLLGGTVRPGLWYGKGSVLFSGSGTTLQAWQPSTGRTAAVTAPCASTQITRAVGNWVQVMCPNGSSMLFDAATGVVASDDAAGAQLLGPGYAVSPSTGTTAQLYDLAGGGSRQLDDVALPWNSSSQPWLPMAADATGDGLAWVGPDGQLRRTTVDVPAEPSLFPPLPVAVRPTSAPARGGVTVVSVKAVTCPKITRHETVAQAKAQLRKLRIRQGDVVAPKGYPKAPKGKRYVVTAFLLETTSRVKSHGKWLTIKHYHVLKAGQVVPAGALVALQVKLEKA